MQTAATADAALVLQTSWTVDLRQHANTFILKSVPALDGCYSNRAPCTPERVQLSWFTGIQLALTGSHFDCSAPLKSPFPDVLNANYICTKHSLAIMAEVDKWEAEYRKTAPPFPT